MQSLVTAVYTAVHASTDYVCLLWSSK